MIRWLLVKLLGMHGKAHKAKDNKEVDSTYLIGL